MLEGLGRLHEAAETKLAPEVAGRRDNRRDDPRPQPVAGREVGHPLLSAHDAPPVAHHMLEPFAKSAKLVRLAAVQGHSLGVLAKADEAEAVVGFVPLPIEVQPDERAAEPVGEPGAGGGVQNGHPNHGARDDDGEHAHRDGERSGQPPQDRHEGHQRDDRAQTAREKTQGVGREEVHIFRDALVRVIGLMRHELHPIVGAIGQPGAEVAVVQPASPADLEHLVEIGLVNGKQDEDADQPRDAEQLPAKGHEVLVLEGAVEGVVPLIQENREVDHAEREEHDGEQEPPRRPSVLREPVRADHGPCVGKRSAQADFGRTAEGLGRGAPGPWPERSLAVLPTSRHRRLRLLRLRPAATGLRQRDHYSGSPRS